MANKILVGIDRDGTIIEDAGYLGKEDDWENHIIVCHGVVEGLKKLRTDNRIRLIVATNQAGVARGFFPVERIEEVDQKIAGILKGRGVEFDGWYFCPYVTSEYAKAKGIPLDNKWVVDNGMRKPGIGMIEQAAKDLDVKLKDFKAVYYLGDKPSDVQTGINSGGKGILITEGQGERYEETKTIMSRNKEKVFFACNVSEAADIILNDLRQTL